MSEQLPAPNFDSKDYERPNQKWICGHAAEGQPCRAGPDGAGRCRAKSECAPVLETKPGETKGRWRCTRPGGTCETGPLPNGTCGRPMVRCSPIPTLRHRRGRFTIAVVTATVALLAIMMGSPPLRTVFINPGGLSTPHISAAFLELLSGTNVEQQTCSACHKAGGVGLNKLATAAFQASPGPLEFAKLAQTKTGEMTAIDEACQKCHRSHAFHQPNVVRDLSCSSCHAEHRRGRMAAPTDAHCTFCHGDAATMAAAAAKGASMAAAAFHARIACDQRAFPSQRPKGGFTQVIHHFASDHPEFRIHAERSRDPDTLKFGHALHLTSQTIPKLPNGEKLSCAFCHQPDAAGIYYRPVKFDSHCRACHSLQFDPETPGLTLPHGDPVAVSAFLHSLPKQYADYAQRSGLGEGGEQDRFVQQKLQKLQALVFSGEDLEKRAFFSTSVAGPAAQVGTVNGATRALYPGCVYCHETKTDSRHTPEITKPVIFDRWLSHGAFDHSKHSKAACSQCHQAEKSKLTSDILLPTKATCAACHSAAGGVADSCTTCHAYHAKAVVGVME